ncbi:hypothetical protein [Nocardioides panacisoli]|uniref:Secreted protein n=1 Tax=Nocardioides panacisoli TaxID=627624 RepID=A0ABP7HX04_9ACTN
MKRSAHLLAALLLGLTAWSSAPAASHAAAPHGTAPHVAPVARSYSDFVRTWYGHTRHLRIRSDHTAREVVYSGCCDHVLNVRYRLGHAHGTTRRGWLHARVTHVRVFDPGLIDNPPHRGDRGRFRVRHGVLTDPFTGTNYCTIHAGQTGACGA